MSNIEDQTKEAELVAKYPWQRTVLVLVATIGILFSGLQYYQSNGLKDATAREKERVSSLNLMLIAVNREKNTLAAEKDSCQQGKVNMISEMLNRELALKLSKDTTLTARKIVESLIKASETLNKQK